MNFGLYDQDGKVISIGSCPTEDLPLQEREGLTMFVGEIDPWDTVDVLTKQRVPGERPPPTYEELRIYPTVESQLDLLWHAMDRGEIPKAETWYNVIKAIKEAHPKPE